MAKEHEFATLMQMIQAQKDEQTDKKDKYIDRRSKANWQNIKSW